MEEAVVGGLLACAGRFSDNKKLYKKHYCTKFPVAEWGRFGGVSRRMSTQFAAIKSSTKRFVAYFSMEIALENAMPSYSGGLGVLAGDTIRAAADLRLPMVALSLLYRKGYFTQRLAEDGSQTEEPVDWRGDDFLTEEPAQASVPIENRRGAP